MLMYCWRPNPKTNLKRQFWSNLFYPLLNCHILPYCLYMVAHTYFFMISHSHSFSLWSLVPCRFPVLVWQCLHGLCVGLDLFSDLDIIRFCFWKFHSCCAETQGWLLLGNKNAAKESFLQRPWPCMTTISTFHLRSTVDAHWYEARRGLRAELLRSTSRTGLRARATHRSHVWALERRSTTEWQRNLETNHIKSETIEARCISRATWVSRLSCAVPCCAWGYSQYLLVSVISQGIHPMFPLHRIPLTFSTQQGLFWRSAWTSSLRHLRHQSDSLTFEGLSESLSAHLWWRWGEWKAKSRSENSGEKCWPRLKTCA